MRDLFLSLALASKVLVGLFLAREGTSLPKHVTRIGEVGTITA